MPPRKPTNRTNDKVDEAVEEAREIAVPLYISRRCTPHQERVWKTICFLLKTHPRADFGLREIAQEAGLTSYPRVKGWIDDLVAMGVLVRITPEHPPDGARDNFPLIRSKYAIPYTWILQESLKLAEEYVTHHVRGGNRLLPSTAPESGGRQLTLDLHVTEGSHEGVTEGSHEGVTEGSHEGVTEGSQSCDRSITESCDPSVTHGWMDGSIVGMDGSIPSVTRTKRDRPGRPPTIPPPPTAETYATHPDWRVGGPLSAHPRDLWRSACPTARPIDDEQLAALAAEHDPATEGHGWYWVGRAVLAVSIDTTPRGVAIVRNTLLRWRAEDSYGSDRARQRSEVPADGRSGATDRGAHGRQRPEPSGGQGAGAARGGRAGLPDEPGPDPAADQPAGPEPVAGDNGAISAERAEAIKRAAREQLREQQARRR